jgi:hypothetical protein
MTVYPLELLPFDAFHKVMTVYRTYLDPEFIPTTMEHDLKHHSAQAIVYWYPQYSIILFELALEGKNYHDWFDQFNTKNYWYFTNIFLWTSKKLDNLLEKKLNKSILDETRIINEKLK